MYLFFDTETTGLPKNWKAPLSDLDNWPRLVQLAWQAYSCDGKLTAQDCCIIKPDGFFIPKEASEIHGITNGRAIKEGVWLTDVARCLHSRISEADILIAHNMSFDEKVIGAEFIRLKLPKITPPRKKICTMLSSTNFCAIPAELGYSGFKWPKLSELHFKLFGKNFEGAHGAAADIAATAKCFWELKYLGVIKI